MWDFMRKNQGNLNYKVGGGRIYANTHKLYDPNPERTRAVNKMVRLLIEKHGGDGSTVKKQIQTNYWTGLVGWKEVKVAEWNEEKREMTLMGEASEWVGEYRRLMGKE